jgi:hypothetical protein
LFDCDPTEASPATAAIESVRTAPAASTLIPKLRHIEDWNLTLVVTTLSSCTEVGTAVYSLSR